MATPIAVFVSPHGFGHAARISAVLEALGGSGSAVEPHLFTTVPRWFFQDSLTAPFGYHELACDVGLVQPDALRVDLPATVEALEGLYGEGREAAVTEAAEAVRARGCRLVVCDVSPLGLLAAERLGLPTVLIESFTWAWIYRGYLGEEPRLGLFADALAEIFERADLRVQTEPICERVDSAVQTAPVSRRPRAGRDAVRRRLGLDPGRPAVLLSMGGVSWRYAGLDRLQARADLDFVIFAGVERIERRANLTLLPDRSPFFHPDLVRASDAVVGKLGYSTVAEAWAAGQRLAYLPRPGWPEHPVLASFVEAMLPSVELGPEGLFGEGGLEALEALLTEPRPAARDGGGAEAVSAAIAGLGV